MRNKILIVDDVELNRELLAEMLGDEYEIIMANNGLMALDILDQRHDEIAVMLLDLVMPEIGGLEVLESINKEPWGYQIGVIIISGDDAIRTEAKCFALGVVDFIHRPFNNRLVKKRVNNIVSLFQYKSELEQIVKEQTKTLTNQYELLQVQAEQLKQSKTEIIDILGNIVEYRNLESGEHIKRVKGYTKILAERLMKDYPEYELTQEKIDIIVAASSLHDIGKIVISDAILLKPGRLTPEEFECMKEHTTKGCEILKNITDVWDEKYSEVSYEICRHHHERYDGRGYPDGLKGEEIPISAQLVSIADVYDALVNERVYKKAFPKDKAFEMISTGECGVFPPKVLECFCKVREEFEKFTDA